MKIAFQSHPKQDRDLVSHSSYTGNNTIEPLIDGEQAFTELFRAIGGARDHIHLSFFKFKADRLGQEFTQHLINKASQGVAICLMIDETGSSYCNDPILQQQVSVLRENGIQVTTIPSLSFVRNRTTWLEPPDHEKIVVIDGEIAFTGGINVADPYRHEWHDMLVRVHGDAVHDIQREWIKKWNFRGGNITVHDRHFPDAQVQQRPTRVKLLQALPSHNRSISEKFLKMISRAEQSIFIEMPYVTEASIYKALIRARQERSVRVVLILPEKNDSRICDAIHCSWTRALLKADIELYRYPGFSHTKLISIDGKQVCLGSSNMDALSFRHTHEMNLIVKDADFAAQIKERLCDPDIRRSTRITHDTTKWIARVKNKLVCWFFRCLK